MGIENEEISDLPTRKKISQPPLNLLFNPTLVNKENVWEINIVKLLEILLNTLLSSGNKDLRICGVAIFTSSLIHKLKVESIFRLEKIANQKSFSSEQVKENTEKQPIPELADLALPFRKEISYPVSLQDLLLVLENMITNLTMPKITGPEIRIKPIEVIDFQDYLIKFEEIVEEYEEKLSKVLSKETQLIFNDFVYGMDKIDVARYFIAMLYLGMKGRIDITINNSNVDNEYRLLGSEEKTDRRKGIENTEAITITLKNP